MVHEFMWHCDDITRESRVKSPFNSGGMNWCEAFSHFEGVNYTKLSTMLAYVQTA